MPLYRGSGVIDPRRRVRVFIKCADLALFLKRTQAVAAGSDVPADLEVVRVKQLHYSDQLELDCLSASFPVIPDGQHVPEKQFAYT